MRSGLESAASQIGSLKIPAFPWRLQESAPQYCESRAEAEWQGDSLWSVGWLWQSGQ